MVYISKALRTLLAASFFHLALSSVSQNLEARNLEYGSLTRRAITPSSEGVFETYWYKWWSDGGADPAWYVNYLPGLIM